MWQTARVSAVLGITLVALAIVQAFLPSLAFPYEPLDEHAHFAYATYLRVEGRLWPNLLDFPFYDQHDSPSAIQNYINHPPTFYWLVALMQSILRLTPQYQVWYRLLPLCGFAATVLVYLFTQRALRVDGLPALTVMFVPLGLMVWATAPFINNDMLGVLGGAVAVWGSVALLGPDKSGAGLRMAVGLALASVKLNEFILVASYCATLTWLARTNSPTETRRLTIWGPAFIGLLCIPYLVFLARYGSPAPDTPGQSRLLQDLAVAQGFAKAPRLNALDYLIHSLPEFFVAMDGGPLFWLTCLIVAGGMICGFFPGRNDMASSGTIVARSAAIATGLTLSLHLTVAYQRHRAYGVLADMYPRYYFPLVGAYAVAAALAVSRAAQWWRSHIGGASKTCLAD